MVSAPGAAPRAVVLCADDYGISEGVSRGILRLAETGRISAASCMTNGPHWPEAGRALRASPAPIGVGLHLTLTWGAPLGPLPDVSLPDGRLPPLGHVLRAALLRRWSGAAAQARLRAEIARQLDAFADALGRPPDFVDGHQHVHVLPGIREALLQVLAGRNLAGRIWLRDPSDGLGAILARRLSAGKAAFVASLAGGFRRDAARAGMATNAGFSGFSPFDGDPGREMRSHLERLGPRPLVMCHPGLADPAPDEIGDARGREYAYLSSPGFPALLESRGLSLAPAPAAPRSGQD